MKKLVFTRGKGHKYVPAKTKRPTGHCSPCSVSAVAYINRHILLLLESKTSTNKQKKQLHLFIVSLPINALKARYDLPFNQSYLAAWLTSQSPVEHHFIFILRTPVSHSLSACIVRIHNTCLQL